MSKKIIISIGSGSFDHLSPANARPGLQKVVKDIDHLFMETFHYEAALHSLKTDPTSNEMRDALGQWFAAADRQAGDSVVLYFTGHGEVVGDELYLLTRDTRPQQQANTAFGLNTLGAMLDVNATNEKFKGTRKFLAILDTCYSGQGAINLLKKFASHLNQGKTECMFFVLSATFPNEPAFEGKLANALRETINDRSIAGHYQPNIFFDQINAGLNKRMPGAEAFYAGFSSAKEVPEFFPNPYYISGLDDALPVADIERIEKQELEHIWGPKARGVEDSNQTGWYFTGREKVISLIRDWFENPQEKAVHVITGQPGSGKSSILARIITSSNRSYLENMPVEERRSSQAAQYTIDLAVYARGKTFEDIIADFAAWLKTAPTLLKVLNALSKLPETMTIVLDALDEAKEAKLIAGEFLKKLQAFPKIKLLLGTRSEYLHYFPDSIHTDIDDPTYITQSDLSQYAKKRLLSTDYPEVQTPYRHDEPMASAIALLIGESAYPNFLIARLISAYLVALPVAVTPAEYQAMGMPATLEDAFGRYFQSFGQEQQRITDLLYPLAMAAGTGLPWNEQWAATASALSGKTYTNADVSDVLAMAGAFIVEALMAGRSVYRVYHQAIADYLLKLKRHDARTANAIMYHALYNTIPNKPDTDSKDWGQAPPYILTYLSSHAGKGGILDQLMADPLFLLSADPDQLYFDLQQYGKAVPPSVKFLFKSVMHLVKEGTTVAPYLQLHDTLRDAGFFGKSKLAAAAPFTWSTEWAIWDADVPHTILAKGNQRIYSSYLAKWNQQNIAITGREGGTCEVWDALTGDLLYTWDVHGHGNPRQLEFAETDNGPILVCYWDGMVLGTVNPNTNARVLKSLPEQLYAITTLKWDGKMACATVDKSSTITIYELPGMEILFIKEKALKSPIYKLAPVTLAGQEALLACGDFVAVARDDRFYGSIHLFDLPGLSHLWSEPEISKKILDQARKINVFDKELVIIARDSTGKAEIWDLEQKKLVFSDTTDSQRSFVYHENGTIKQLNILRNRLYFSELIGNSKGISKRRLSSNSIERQLRGINFELVSDLRHGAFLLSQENEHMNLWDVSEVSQFNQKPRKTFEIPDGVASACKSPDEKLLFIGYAEGILVIDSVSGAVKRKIETGQYGKVKFLCHPASGNILIAGTSSGHLITIGYSKPGILPKIISRFDSITALTVVKANRRNIIVVNIGNGHRYEVRLFNLRTFKEYPTDGRYTLSGGQEDKPLFGLAANYENKTFNLAFSSRYGQVQAARYHWKVPPLHIAFERWSVPETGNEYVRALAITKLDNYSILAAGTDNGNIAICMLPGQATLFKMENAHSGPIGVLQFVNLGQKPALASGGTDGMFRLWSLELGLLLEIEIGISIDVIIQITDAEFLIGTIMGAIKISINTDLLNNYFPQNVKYEQ